MIAPPAAAPPILLLTVWWLLGFDPANSRNPASDPVLEGDRADVVIGNVDETRNARMPKIGVVLAVTELALITLVDHRLPIVLPAMVCRALSCRAAPALRLECRQSPEQTGGRS